MLSFLLFFLVFAILVFIFIIIMVDTGSLTLISNSVVLSSKLQRSLSW